MTDETATPKTADGVDVNDLASMQKNMKETESAPLIRPSELEGVSNNPALSNAQLTSEVVELKRRLNNIAATLGDF